MLPLFAPHPTGPARTNRRRYAWAEAVPRFFRVALGLIAMLPGVVLVHAGEAPLRVGVLVDNDPYSYRDADGEIRGFAVDLLAGIERHLGLTLQRVTGTTSEINASFAAGQLDLLQSYARSEAREDHADFSVPYLSMSGSIFTRREDASEVTSLADLRGKRVLVHPGSLGERLLLDAGLEASIVPVESVEQAFRFLHEGRGDATLAARLTGLATVHRLRLHRIVPAGRPLDEFAIDYCFAVQDGDRALLAKVNEGLAILQRTGELDAIHRRWFGHLNPATYTVVDVLIATSAGLTLALLIAVGFFFHQRRLRLRLAAQATALRTSEELHRGIFDASPDALLLLREDTGGGWRIEQANRAFAALLGQTQAPASGLLLDRFPPIASALEERLAHAGGRAEPAFTEHALELGGMARWVRAATVPVGDGLLVILSDISAEREARDRWHESERQLRQAQKLEAIGTLASGIAHDFNNILTGIGGNTEISRLRLPPDHPVQAHLAEVIQGAARAAALVRQILTFARKTESRRQRLNAAEAVDETLRFLRATSPRSVVLEHRRSPVPVVIDADPTQLQQVLMNLGTNAVQAFDGTQGGVVYAEEIDPEGNPCILVSDTGPGMTPEVAARIFEPFYTTKPAGKGTGLGLSVAHGIMESHGGSISVQSAPGIGTTFRLRFPPPQAQAATELPVPSSALRRGKGEHILLVDDEATITNVATNLLRRLGYQVTARHDPREALHDFISRPESFDLLLSDLTMPGMNGLDLIATIRATRPGLPCLLMSGYLGAEQEARTRAANLNGILDKPLATETLADAVARALARP